MLCMYTIKLYKVSILNTLECKVSFDTMVALARDFHIKQNKNVYLLCNYLLHLLLLDTILEKEE